MTSSMPTLGQGCLDYNLGLPAGERPPIVFLGGGGGGFVNLFFS